MARREFQTVAELGEWLAGAGVDLSVWGVGNAKTLSDLWREYLAGEASFDDDPPARWVEVAQLTIRRGDAMLLETEQLFADGRRRVRLRPPSEKVLGSEPPRDAALRCLLEELALSPSDAAIASEAEIVEETADSPSYPGLLTRYRFHAFEVKAAGLPDEDFYRDNAAPNDPIHRHCWGWRLEEKSTHYAYFTDKK